MPDNSFLLRLPALEARLGLSPSSIYRLLAKGDLPKPVQLTDRAVAWRSAEIDEWIASRQPANNPPVNRRRK
jgi:prophage regulatory protein